MTLSKFRVLQVTISTTIFVIVFCYFFITSPKSITTIQLSYWGTLSWIWNLALLILSITMFYNIYSYTVSIPKFRYKKSILILFATSCLSLAITAIFNVNTIKIIHNVSAFYYFFSLPLGIFLIAHCNSKTLIYKQWMSHIIFSLSLITIPIYLIHLYEGMAIPETIHSIIIFLWNFYILPKKY